MKFLVALIPAVLIMAGCATQEAAPSANTQAIVDPVPTSTQVTLAETPVPISTPPDVGYEIVIVAPTPLPPGTPLPQNWRLETAVRPEGSGNITLSPQQEHDLYFLGSSIEATANCDVGFLRWEGDIPEGSDKTANPITLSMDGPSVLYAFCVDLAPTPTGIPSPTSRARTVQ